MSELWPFCLDKLSAHIDEPNLNTWIKPLQTKLTGNTLHLFAPNKFIFDRIESDYFSLIKQIVLDRGMSVSLTLGESAQPENNEFAALNTNAVKSNFHSQTINPKHSFDNFVEGKSNQFAKAAAFSVIENPSEGYNPLFIYGGVGLGKTHLIHALGNALITKNPNHHVVYIHAEKFVTDFVQAMANKTINSFKQHYRNVDALLIDDIQFFVGKPGSQEEFFHTFNTLFEKGTQIVLTSDRYPKEIEGLEERLKSRFGWGLAVSINPPELETRVAILKKKAQQSKINLPDEVAFFIAKRIRSNVRELEGALRRVNAHANFSKATISIEFAKEALKDLIAVQNKQVSIENIQKTVADYFKIRLSDMLSIKRSRSITRPRQIAMALTKELTNHSLPEIGDSFGGRDHTTVLHACRKVDELRQSDNLVEEDYLNLHRTLTH